MAGLRAVYPDRSGVVDGNGIGSGVSRTSRNRHEAREETGDIAVHGDGLAWLVEGGLSDGMVATSKLELNHITHSGGDAVGRVGDRTGLRADGDDVNGGGLRKSAADEGGDSESRELHFGLING